MPWFRRRPRRIDLGSKWDELLPPNFGKRRRRRDRDKDEGGVPVEPNKPKNLSGGAAAALEFDED